MTSDCSRYDDIIIRPCSSRGDCIDNKCICKHGFSSRADFELDFFYDCDINLNAIKVLSLISLLFAIFMLLAGLNNIIYSPKGNDIKTHLREPKTFVDIFFTISSIGAILYSFPKVVHPELAVVGDASNKWGVITSIGFSFGYFGLMNGWAFFMVHIASFLRKSARILSRESQDILKNNQDTIEKMGIRLGFVNICYLIFPVIASHIPQKADSILIGFLVLKMSMIVTTAYIIAHILLKSFIIELGKFIALGNVSLDMLIMHKRIKIIQIIAYAFAFVIAPVHIIFISWPYLRRKYTYAMLVILINSIIPSIGVLILLAPSSVKSNNSLKVSPTDIPRSRDYIVSEKQQQQYELTADSTAALHSKGFNSETDAVAQTSSSPDYDSC